MEMDYRPSIDTDVCYIPPYHPNGDIKKIIDGTKKSLSVTTRESSYEFIELQERVKNISMDAIRRIGERLFSDDSLISNILLLSLELQGNSITEEAKELLINNKELLFSLANVVENIIKIKDYNFEIKKIDLGRDPENPEWRPILINLEIISDKFEKKLELKHKIIKKAFKQIDKEARKNIFIIGAI